MKICDKNTCTGCFACMNSCPKDAINIYKNEFGVTLPKIDENKCINCGICQNICPVNSIPQFNRADKSYAAFSTNDTESSSGGIAAVMSRHILNKGGTVYGAAVVDRKTKHIRVSNFSDLELLRGSKYVQSQVGLIYREVKIDLINKLPVLFIGTPCQIAGLNAFLQRHYENLITVDLICHGTPPHQYLSEHLNGKKWDSYSFRGKYDFILTAYNKNKITYQKSCREDLYFDAFLKSLTYRENCYSCSYAKPDRVSDLTIGDFWGLDDSALINQHGNRISVILPNTPKGQYFFNEFNSNIIWEERSFIEAANKFQGNLLRPSIPHPDREYFLKLYPKKGFNYAVSKTTIGKDVKQTKLNRSLIVGAIRKIVAHILKGETIDDR